MKKITGLFLMLMLLQGCAMAEDTAIVFEDSSVTVGDGALADGTTVTIVDEGRYVLKGRCPDGRVVVDAEKGSVTLVLSGLDLTNMTGPVICALKTGSLKIELAEGTENVLTDGRTYVLEGDIAEADAAVYSKSDVAICGSGSLKIYASGGSGIVSKDTLTIENGNIEIFSENHGMKGKDYLLIIGGDLLVSAAKDGLKSTNDKQKDFGYISIRGGHVTVSAEDDGLFGESMVEITDGQVDIETTNNAIRTPGLLRVTGGQINIVTDDDGIKYEEKEISDNAVILVNGLQVYE